MPGLGIKLLKPWFVAIGTLFTAASPMEARELISTEFIGRRVAPQLASPSAVRHLPVLVIDVVVSLERSLGDAHGMSPSQ